MATPIPTASDIIATALRKAGVVGIDEDIEQPILNDGLADANDMLAQWQRKRYLIYRLQDFSFVSTGAQFYTVGDGQNFPINPRPDRLESAFLRELANGQGQNIDWELSIIPSKEDYNRIILKSLGTFSWRIFYDPDWPIGKIYPWPVPQASLYEIHATFKTLLQQFAALKDNINLPPEYVPALKWGLARRFRASYQLPADPEINALARDALNTIRLANTAVPLLSMPEDVRRRGPAYDYHSDNP